MRNKPNYLQESTPQKQGFDQEKKARLHIASGRVWFDPLDISYEDYEIDVKHAHKSFVFNLKKVDRIYQQAIPKTPAYLIYMGDYVIKATIEKVVK